MDTPITVSSTSTLPNKSDFLQLNYSPETNEQSVISLGSTNCWKSDKTFPRTDSNTTLTNIQKVSNWIRSIEKPKHDSVTIELNEGIKDNSFKGNDEVEHIMEECTNSDSKSVILLRCDFNKSTYSTFSRSPPKTNFLKVTKKKMASSPGTSTSSKSETTVKKRSPSSTNKRSVQRNIMLKHSESSQPNNCCDQYNSKIRLEKVSPKVNDVESNGSSDLYVVPLSPESRKKELCSYLQLMNPADKKERFILQNRRSTRVRNLTAMQEKKKQMDEKFINSKESELLEKDVEKCPTLKSFKELNIKVETSELGQELSPHNLNDSERDNFYFPFPPKDIIEKVQDFDNTMSKLISRYKRICRMKNLKLHCRKMEKSVPKNKNSIVKDRLKTNFKEEHKANIKKKLIIAKSNKLKIRGKSKERQVKDFLRKRFKSPIKRTRTNTLRSTGRLRNVSLKKLIVKKEKELLNRKNMAKKVREQQEMKRKPPLSKKSCVESPEVNLKIESSKLPCEVICKNKVDIDMENLIDDIVEFENLTEEHKKYLMENRILSKKPTLPANNSISEEETSKSFYSLDEISPLYGFNQSDINEIDKICEAYKNSVLNCSRTELTKELLFGKNDLPKLEDKLIEEVSKNKTDERGSTKTLTDSNLESEDVEATSKKLNKTDEDEKSTSSKLILTNGVTLQEHDYAGMPSNDEAEDENEADMVTVPNKNLIIRSCMEINPRFLEKKSKLVVSPFNKSVEVKSLHRSLQYVKRKNDNSVADQSFAREWDADNSSKQKSKKQSHYISINKQNGIVLKAFYVDYNLILCQENIVSFWMQTPLGNVLGSQNMWIPRGHTQRLVLNGKCMQKESMEMVIAMETDVAYIELWTKEHKSEVREWPVADVFATVYFWKQRQNGLEKKVLQLENINGFADDVQYSVMKSVPKIIVSWHSAHDDCASKRTFIHAYELAADYQTVAKIYNIEPVDHYVSSLHNIEDCDSLVMGCGENKITLWNLNYGYIIATIVLSEIKSPLSTLWVKCDRGFLFALQQCVDRELRLIAINGINHSWKKLASYVPPEGFDRLRGVCIENGLLLSFYDQGILCWKAETGEPVEETNIESDIIPSGNYVILIEDEQILVKHALTHLMSLSIDET